MKNKVVINKEAVKNKVEPFIYNKINLPEVEVHNEVPVLTHNRFDLAFKILFLESILNFKTKRAEDIYKEHIRAFSLGSFKEPGNEDKNSLNKFINTFKSLYEDIKTNGFNENTILVPLSKDGTILNGAHRTAICIYLKKQLRVVNTMLKAHQYDYNFFYNRNVADDILDEVATKYVEYSENIYIALLWPTAQGKDKEIEEIIPNIVYRKNVDLNNNGAHNLLSEVYFGENWIGNKENNFKGVKKKLVECFKNKSALRAIAFQAESLDKVLEIKEEVRKLFNVGKHSIHITDTKDEAVQLSRMLFNNNSIHFLNHAKPNTILSTHEKIEKFKINILKNKVDFKNVLLDGGIMLSLYGVREASDIDYFIAGKDKLKDFENLDIEVHDKELVFHNKEKIDLIFNPTNYFYFNDLKFVSYKQLYEMKRNRYKKNLNTKDKNDYQIMDAMIEKKTIKKHFYYIKQVLYYQGLKLIPKIKSLLKITKLETPAKYIYKKISKK